MRTLIVVAPGPLTTVQDLGRVGRGAEGIGRSGVCDRESAALANRLVRNHVGDALLEVTAGGLTVRAEGGIWMALTGARCPGTDYAAPFWLADGQQLHLGAPTEGMRTYLAVRGGIDVDPVLGSRATDLLSGLGPRQVRTEDRLPVGTSVAAELSMVDLAPVSPPPSGEVDLPLRPGPRSDWFTDDAHALLTTSRWTVTAESNRVGLRLDGPGLTRRRRGELTSEGMVRGALQVPPNGRPVLFLADHPVTGGYPVIGYVAEPDVDRCGQLAPGQTLRLRAQPTRRPSA